MIKFIRVGDLQNEKKSVYVNPNNNLKSCNEDDIMISFDGAPGRMGIGLNGYYSSGIRKIEIEDSKKGLVYFSLKSEHNQNIIKMHSKGTTILHASDAIPFLELPVMQTKDEAKLNSIFLCIVRLSKKINVLNCIKNNLLKKYFSTNQ